MKTCLVCKEQKSEAKFPPRSRKCRTCSHIAWKQKKIDSGELQSHRENRTATWEKNRIAEGRDPERINQLKRYRRYGPGAEVHFEKLKEIQRGRCALCGEEEKVMRNGVPLSLSCDHDHETGALRELLCKRCNTGLGVFKDDPDFLERAARYIRKYRL